MNKSFFQYSYEDQPVEITVKGEPFFPDLQPTLFF